MAWVTADPHPRPLLPLPVARPHSRPENPDDGTGRQTAGDRVQLL